ncbi:hypothetical protein [Halobacillus sp. Marseille-Q1614]|uniref:hypothetical protein n=1 Tax=Halobacillus sp. Marseille-Q1614 TaxID=2709134 RepID=UPI001570F73A|nr:hypothetical protein [Halobacillus sp. Marseille-Q1614]
MWPIMAIVFTAAGIFFIEVPKLKREKKKKDIVYFCILLAAATTVSILEAIGTNLPNPADLIQWYYAPVNAWLDKIFN